MNKKAEAFFREILNIVYDWNLRNLNAIQNNYPAIDLADSTTKVCIQVTAENSSSKISKTISKFREKKLYKNYNRLILLVITDKKNYTAQFQTGGEFAFSKTDDIKDIDDLLTDIERLPLEKLNELHEFLKKELSAIISATAEPNSLLAKAEKRISLPPTNGEKFFAYLQCEDDERKQGLSDLKEFYERLTDLPQRTRQYLYLIITRGSASSRFGDKGIAILPRKLESLLDLSQEESAEEFRILEKANIASHDEEARRPLIEVSVVMDTGVELLEALKEFAQPEDVLRDIIVNCDFTKLDTV